MHGYELRFTNFPRTQAEIYQKQISTGQQQSVAQLTQAYNAKATAANPNVEAIPGIELLNQKTGERLQRQQQQATSHHPPATQRLVAVTKH